MMSDVKRVREPLYKGENQCLRHGCSRKAYYTLGEEPRCGYHSSSADRVPMVDNPGAGLRKRLVALGRYDEARKGTAGKLSVAKLQKFAPTPYEPGFFTVLPNVGAGTHFPDHLNPDYVIKCRNLSPFLLGPVNHGQPGLPPCRTLEWFHQANKVFRVELSAVGEPLPIFYERRLAAYMNPRSQRHKLGTTKAEHTKALGKNESGCVFSIFVHPKTGEEMRLTYIESRALYCSFYEHLASQTLEWPLLLRMYNDKRSLLIAGPDARPVGNEVVDTDQIKEWYMSPDLPFGHEMVLYVMLLLNKVPAYYPWRSAWLRRFGATFRDFYGIK